MNHRQPQLGDIGIIALVPDRWGPVWMDRHHVLVRLAKYFHVAWVYQPSWRELFSVLRRPKGRSIGLPAKPASLHIYEPPIWLPRIGRPARLAQLSSKWRLKQVSDFMRAQGCTKLVLFLWDLQFADALQLIPHDLSIYNISDEYSFSRTEVPVSAAERRLLQSVGQVFIISPGLMEKKGHFNPNTEFMPCGVDYLKYATPAPEPDDLRAIPHPRIGYLGHLKAMLNWPLLLELSAIHTNWSFVFVGPRSLHPEIDSALRKMSQRSNVYFLGGKPADCLGKYVQHFDVCIMPYVLDDYTKYIYPGKMHEYLASGNPVVSTPIRSVEEFRNVISVAAGREDWSNAINHALSTEENSAARRTERQRIAHDYDWDVLVGRIADTIGTRLGTSVTTPVYVNN